MSGSGGAYSTGRVGIDSFEGCSTQRLKINMATQMRRFDNFPKHKKCYRASATATDELAREIESSMQSAQVNTRNLLVDPFGKTPLHVLLSGANCRLDLLQVLLDAYSLNVLGWKDVNGRTAIDYYCQQSDQLTDDARHILLYKQPFKDGWWALYRAGKSWKYGHRIYPVG